MAFLEDSILTEVLAYSKLQHSWGGPGLEKIMILLKKNLKNRILFI